MMMSNCTAVTEFLLLGFSDALALHILHLATFLIIYLAALIGNLLVIMLTALDSHLHTPMYFFLLNLSILDIGSISVIVPKSLANSILNTRLISYSGCVTQVFLLQFFIPADISILTIMAYDRYIAICKPLHYEAVMSRRACLQMAATAWSAAFLNSALHTGNIFRLPFCHSNIVNQFFCEFPQLLSISLSEVSTSEIQILIFSVSLCLVCIVFIFVSYIQIFTTVLRIPSEQGRHKAVSTCLPHLIVVTLMASTGMIAYMKPTSESPSALDLMLSVLYSMIPPMMNPIIYSMRNKDIKAALWKLVRWKWFIVTKMSVIVQ